MENGRFHKRGPPKHAGDNWLGSAILIGSTGWCDFKFLFFTVYGELFQELIKISCTNFHNATTDWTPQRLSVKMATPSLLQIGKIPSCL